MNVRYNILNGNKPPDRNPVAWKLKSYADVIKFPHKPNEMKKVLIVEDESDMCLLLNILLAGKEIEVDHVKNLSGAELYLMSTQPTVLILDNKLPDGLGIDFIPYLKGKYPDLKIIMISGFDKAARDVALDNGADIFLHKPFTRDQLYTSIKDLIN
jgi:two-component system, OmpR family, response regulator